MLACLNGYIDIARMLLGEFHANIDIQNKVRAIVRLVLCGDVRVVVVVGNVVVVADIGTYLVSIFVTLTCIIFLLLHHCIGVLMMFYNPRAICSISLSWYMFFIF